MKNNESCLPVARIGLCITTFFPSFILSNYFGFDTSMHIVFDGLLVTQLFYNVTNRLHCDVI